MTTASQKQTRKEQAEKRAQRYSVELSEHQLHLLVAPLERLAVHERTKPERELLKLLVQLKPLPAPKAKPKKAKPRAKQSNRRASQARGKRKR